MKQFPKLRPCLWDGLIAGTVLALAVVCGLLFWKSGESEGTLTAVVSIDGAEQERILLDGEEGESRRTYTHNGYTLEVLVNPEGSRGIRVEESDCPTQDCVRTGTISHSGQSIVCLPARLIITLEGGPEAEDGVDAVLG